MTRHEDSRSQLAPMVKPEMRPTKTGWCNERKHTPQAATCPICRAVLAIGPSFQDHVFWCRRENHDE